jgi:hypothetical protein
LNEDGTLMSEGVVIYRKPEFGEETTKRLLPIVKVKRSSGMFKVDNEEVEDINKYETVLDFVKSNVSF